MAKTIVIDKKEYTYHVEGMYKDSNGKGQNEKSQKSDQYG